MIKNNSIYALFMCVFVCVVITTAQAFQAPATPKPTKFPLRISMVKVNPSVVERTKANDQASELALVRESVDGKLAAALEKTKKFDIIAGNDLDAVKEEQDLGRSGVVDQGDKNTAKSGKVAGAKYIVVTTIDNFQDVVQTASFEGVGQKMTKRNLSFSVVVKILDSTTGKSLHTASIVSEPLNPVVANNPSFITQQKGGDVTEKAIVELGTQMAQSVANEVVDYLYPAKIISITAGQVTINRSQGTGIQPKQIWNVYALGEDEIDPDTGESLGKAELKIGQVIIDEVGPTKSTAQIKGNDAGIQKGFIVRIDKNSSEGAKTSPGAVSGTNLELPKTTPQSAPPLPPPLPSAVQGNSATISNAGATSEAATPAKPAPPYGAAIFVKNRCKEIPGDDVSKLEDLIIASLETKCIRPVSREDVINSVKNFAEGGPNAGTQGSVKDLAKTARDVYDILKGGAERYEDLDKKLSDNASASQIAGMMGCEYVLISSLVSLDTHKKHFRSERMGLDVDNMEYTLTATYKILDASTGRTADAGKVQAIEIVENTVNLKEEMSILGPLYNQAAEKLAEKLNARCDGGAIIAPTAPVAGAGIIVVCTMQDFTVPDVNKDPKTGAYTITKNSFNLQPEPFSATVTVDGVAVGSAPNPDMIPLKASVGIHKVAVTRTGFKPWNQIVSVPADRPLQLIVALQMDEPSYQRWKDNTVFLQGLKKDQQLTDAQAKVLEGMAESLKQSGYRVDYKVDTKDAPTNLLTPGFWSK